MSRKMGYYETILEVGWYTTYNKAIATELINMGFDYVSPDGAYPVWNFFATPNLVRILKEYGY